MSVLGAADHRLICAVNLVLLAPSEQGLQHVFVLVFSCVSPSGKKMRSGTSEELISPETSGSVYCKDLAMHCIWWRRSSTILWYLRVAKSEQGDCRCTNWQRKHSSA